MKVSKSFEFTPFIHLSLFSSLPNVEFSVVKTSDSCVKLIVKGSYWKKVSDEPATVLYHDYLRSFLIVYK